MGIRRKPRNFWNKFESVQCPEKLFYNNVLWVAVEAVWSEPVSAKIP